MSGLGSWCAPVYRPAWMPLAGQGLVVNQDGRYCKGPAAATFLPGRTPVDLYPFPWVFAAPGR
jgi:hypothetical protein